MNRDIELIDRRIVTHEAIIEILRALRSDFEAERRAVAEIPVTAPATSKSGLPLRPPATTLDIQAGTDRLCAENARLKTKAPAAQQSPKPPAQHSVSLRDRIIEHLSNRAMSGSELAHATGYSQVSIYKALRRMRADRIVATREESDRTKKNFLLSRTEMAAGACDQNAVTARIDDRSSASPAPEPSPIPRPVSVRRRPGRPQKAPVRPGDPPPPPGLSIRDQIINLLLVRPMTSAELIQTMGCIPNSVYDALAKMRNTGVVKMRDDSADGVRKNYLTTQPERMTPKPQPAAAPEL
jgi:DNA-binding transcriptional regulator GbsR (MarR family)